MYQNMSFAVAFIAIAKEEKNVGPTTPTTNERERSLPRPSTLPFARQVFYGCPREHRENRERILEEEIGFDSHPHCELRAAWQQSESPLFRSFRLSCTSPEHLRSLNTEKTYTVHKRPLHPFHVYSTQLKGER